DTVRYPPEDEDQRDGDDRRYGDGAARIATHGAPPLAPVARRDWLRFGQGQRHWSGPVAVPDAAPSSASTRLTSLRGTGGTVSTHNWLPFPPRRIPGGTRHDRSTGG